MSVNNPEIVTNTAGSAPVAAISALAAHEGERVTLRGWLYNIRSSGKLLFPTFRDGTGTIQGIVPRAAVPPEVFDRVKSLTQESSVIVTGRVRADSRAPSGFELDVENVEIVHLVPESTPFPISLKEHGTDFLMEHRHLWVRTPRQSAILRIRATIMRAAQEYFDTHGFIRTDPPILTPAACEGTSTLFELDYFGDPAFLTQSGQLYVEATALALGKVYSFGPTFRAEKSKTRRHLTEFWMIEPEVAFMDLEGDMDLAEAFLIHIVSTVLANHRADLKVIGRDIAKLEAVIAPAAADSPLLSSQSAPLLSSRSAPLLSSRSAPLLSSRSAAEGSASPTAAPSQNSVILSEGAAAVEGPAVSAANQNSESVILSEGAAAVEGPAVSAANQNSESVILSEGAAGVEGPAVPTTPRFPRLTYDQAHAMLERAFAEGKLEAPHIYGDDLGSPDETYISSQFDRPVMIHRYPAASKAFYMQPDPADPTKALCVDVLAPEGYGEIIGGSQRVDSYELLRARILEHNLPLAAFEWYLDLRRYGSVPHSGFGMGIERAVAWICGLDHVRETIPFARTLNRIYP
jgi:aspartyl/asparaginyl-tRNA synthetase